MAGQSGTLSNTGDLTVYYQIDFNHDGIVNFLDTVYFCNAYFQFNQNHVFDPVCDLNHDGAINFMDLVIFADLYIAYYQTQWIAVLTARS